MKKFFWITFIYHKMYANRMFQERTRWTLRRLTPRPASREGASSAPPTSPPRQEWWPGSPSTIWACGSPSWSRPCIQCCFCKRQPWVETAKGAATRLVAGAIWYIMSRVTWCGKGTCMETRPEEPVRLASEGWRLYAPPGVCSPRLIVRKTRCLLPDTLYFKKTKQNKQNELFSIIYVKI